MVCKNCGAKLKDNATRCSNCGAVVDSGYVIDITKYAVSDTEGEKYLVRKRRHNKIKITIAIMLALALGFGSYMFFDYQHNNKTAPDLYFQTGTGIANDKKIIYLTIDDSSEIEYIHGVKLYDGDLTKPNLKKSDPISTDYQYTKNAEESFRSIFFYADDLGIKKDKIYTYTFEVTFGFAEDTNFYTYQQMIKFSGDIKDDATQIVFDHSLKEEMPTPPAITTTTTTVSQEQTTEPEPTDISFIYNGFWFTTPYSEGDNHYISCWSFNKNATISVSSYSYENGKWSTSTSTIKYATDGNKLYVDDGEGEIATFIANPKELKITQRSDDDSSIAMELVSRKYNSISNVEDFFGM